MEARRAYKCKQILGLLQAYGTTFLVLHMLEFCLYAKKLNKLHRVGVFYTGNKHNSHTLCILFITVICYAPVLNYILKISE